MAKKFKNKKEVNAKYTKRIQEIKAVYEQNKLKTDPGFYFTDAYKDLDRRRKRALRRYDNREQINQRRRQNNELKKELPTRFDKVTDTSVYQAYNGAGRIYEDALIQKQKDGLGFKGSVEYKKAVSYFSNYADFRRDTNRIISIIYRLLIKSGSDELFLWRVTRSYSIREKTVFINYKFYRVDGKEDET